MKRTTLNATARTSFYTIESDGEGLGSDGVALGRCPAQDAVRVGRREVLALGTAHPRCSSTYRIPGPEQIPEDSQESGIPGKILSRICVLINKVPTLGTYS